MTVGRHRAFARRYGSLTQSYDVTIATMYIEPY